MLAADTWELRKVIAQAEDVVGPDRYVNMSVRMHVVKQDLAHGAEVIAGLAPVSSLRSHRFGGVVDSRTSQIVHWPIKQSAIWYASEEQEPLILHSDAKAKLLVYGAFGSGKTVVLARWLILRALEFTGLDVEIGACAPTNKRLSMVIDALVDAMPSSWYTYRAKDMLFYLRNGVRIRLVATAPPSAALGSPVQGFNWAANATDEAQDALMAHPHIEARGRRAPRGVYKRFCTATAKDSPEWRTFRDRIKKSSLWNIHRLEGGTNPFVYPVYWENLREEYSERDYKRFVLAQDVGPETAVYPMFAREHNIRPIPNIGATDITRRVTNGYHAILGHDPGTTTDVTEVMKVYDIGGTRHWWVIDEICTKGTTEQHIIAVRERLQQNHDLQWPDEDEPKVLVRCDPQGDSDHRTDKSIYTEWRQAGFRILSAAYDRKGQPRGRVPKEPRIQMLGKLICAASGVRRFFIDCDDKGKPCAPCLMEGLEMSERDAIGNAEMKVKGKKDLSHHPCSVGYGIWPYEKLRDATGITASGLAL